MVYSGSTYGGASLGSESTISKTDDANAATASASAEQATVLVTPEQPTPVSATATAESGDSLVTLDVNDATATGSAEQATATTVSIASVSSAVASATAEQADGVVDPIIVTNDTDPLTFTTSELGASLVSPSNQDAQRPGFRLKNQTEATTYDVAFRWKTSLDSCLDIGVSDEPETSIGDTQQTSDSDVTVTRIKPQDKGGIWIYADPSNCSYGLSSAETWLINATPVAQANDATASASAEQASATTV